MTKSKPTVTDTINGYPKPVRAGVLALRDLILETADEIEGVGLIEEALRWGQPSYLTSETGSGGLLFKAGASIPTDEVRQCIAMALTYHLRE